MSAESDVENPNLLAVAWTGPAPADASDIVVFIHGITANAKTWPLVIGRLPADIATLSVDLRGRADSAEMPGPWGMNRHADDVVALLDAHGITQPVLFVGHSMGAFVTSNLVNRYPGRARGAVLVDGGVKLITQHQETQHQDAEAVLQSVLGPALQRLSVHYRSRDEYRLFWQEHPAFVGQTWSEFLENYIQHDLGGLEPYLASRAKLDAVRQDGYEIFLDSGVVAAVETMGCPTELLLAERGLLNQPEPLITVGVARAAAAKNPNLRVTSIPGVNHYTIVMIPAGADAVAAAIRRQL